MTRSLLLLLAALVIAGSLAACGGTPSSNGGEVSSVAVDPDAVVLELGASADLVATVDGDGRASGAVSWRSSDRNIVTVDDGGRVTAVGGGSAVITATSLADPSAAGAATIRVPVVASVRIEPAGPLQLGVGGEVHLAAVTESLGGASAAVTWASSDDAVASVDAGGLVSTHALGVAVIRATSVADATKHADVGLTVVPGGASTVHSVVSADDAVLPADGQATTTVWVRLRDDAGNPIGSSGGIVTMAAPTTGELGPVEDLQDGRYRATYTSGTEPGAIRIEAQLDGQPLHSVANIDLERVLGSTIWLRQFGSADDETVTSVDVNDDGVTAVVGHTQFSTVLVRVFDAHGELLWSRDEGTESWSDYATSVVIDDHGSVYVAGLAQGGWAGDRVGDADAFVRKYDENGVIRWTRLVTASWGSFYFNAIALTPEGDVVVGGRYGASGESGHKVHKFSASGDLIWSTPVFGSVTYDEIHAIAVGSDGIVYVAGKTGARYSSSRPSLRIYSTNGDLLSAETIDVPGAAAAYASDVSVMGRGSTARTFITGQAFFEGGYRPWIAEPRAWVWTAPDIGTARGVVVHDDALLFAGDGVRFGGHAAAGGTDAFLAEFSLEGDLRSVRAFGTPEDETAAAVAVAADGTVTFAGSTAGAMTESPSAGGTDGFVARVFW